MATTATGSQTIETCNAMKADLRAAYPDAIFSVRATRWFKGLAIVIHQTDGPEFFDVVKTIAKYGSTFAEDQDEASIYLQEDGGAVLPCDTRTIFLLDGMICKVVINRKATVAA